jgi:methanogenic corrinoid protein MtbC1
MIRWCAYCQSYQGEKAPFEDYSITHTICERCAADGSTLTADAIARIEPVRALFSRLAEPASGDSPAKLVDEALSLGIAPIDLLLGIVQPVLYDVGARWARGEASVEDEHEITRRCLAVYDALRARQSRHGAASQWRPDVLLASAPGNTHTLGLRIIELFLFSEEFTVRTEFTPRSVSELVALVRECEPRVVALSAALEEHLEAAAEVASRLAAPRAVPVCVGGRVLQDTAVVAGTTLRACGDFRALPSLIEDLARASTEARPRR